MEQRSHQSLCYKLMKSWLLILCLKASTTHHKFQSWALRSRSGYNLTQIVQRKLSASHSFQKDDTLSLLHNQCSRTLLVLSLLDFSKSITCSEKNWQAFLYSLKHSMQDKLCIFNSQLHCWNVMFEGKSKHQVFAKLHQKDSAVIFPLKALL